MTPLKTNTTTTKKPKAISHANFIEALKSSTTSIAKDTISGLAKDFLAGSVKQGVDTLFSPPARNQSSENPENQFDFSEYLHANESRTRAHERVKYEYQQTETVIFNRRQQEIDQKIEQIRLELKRLAQEIVYLDQSTQAVIQQEVANPGTYHVNFFEKLLNFLRYLRKRVVESRHWASLQAQRSSAKSYFWHHASKKVGGTKFLLSHERTVATQTG